MTWEITTPSGVEVEVEAENDAYLQSLKERGYEVKPKTAATPKMRVYTGESVCTACEG